VTALVAPRTKPLWVPQIQVRLGTERGRRLATDRREALPFLLVAEDLVRVE